MWRAHEVQQTLRTHKHKIEEISEKPVEEFWPFFFVRAENTGGFGGKKQSYLQATLHNHDLIELLGAYDFKIPGIQQKVRDIAKELDKFPKMNLGMKIIKFESEFGIPFHVCKFE